MRIMKKSLILILFLAILALLLNGCGKAECKVNSDCPSVPGKSASCTEKQCSYNSLPNACGNGIMDALEDGKKGSKCTCPEDWGGKCEGKEKIERDGREYDAQYLEYYCNARQDCVFGVDKNKARPIDLIDERQLSYFTLETKTSFIRPMDVASDKFTFRIALKDKGKELVLPVKITKVTVTGGEVLFGENANEGFLNGIGDSLAVQVPITYIPEYSEEEKALGYKIDYEYRITQQGQRLENGSFESVISEPQRSSFDKYFRESVFLVKA